MQNPGRHDDDDVSDFVPPHRDIYTSTLKSWLTPRNDGFGTETRLCRPLLIDRIMEGQSYKSRSSVFHLPSELLSDIAYLLADDRESLASLALVNSDFLLLARSCQFAEVRFDCSAKSIEFLRRLTAEGPERQSTGHYGGRGISIGAFIRRFTMDTSGREIFQQNKHLYEVTTRPVSGDVYRKTIAEAKREANRRYEAYRHDVLQAIGKAMPNLECVTWLDKYAVSGDFFNLLFETHARHIILGQTTCLEPPVLPPTWPLRSLSISTYVTEQFVSNSGPTEGDELPRRSLAPEFFISLFRKCAPTLESLTWRYSVPYNGTNLSFGHERIAFPRLQTAYLRGLVSIDHTVLPSLLDAQLSHLALPEKLPPKLSEALADCPTMRDLETLVIYVTQNWKGPDVNPDHYEEFLARHSHIMKLHFHEGPLRPPADQFLDTKIIPTLSTKFTSLRSLSLGFGGGITTQRGSPMPTVTASSLSAIGKIQSLEQLHLTAGENATHRHQYLVDHDLVRRHLAALTRLKKLAFSRDTYRLNGNTDTEVADVDLYYDKKAVPAGHVVTTTQRPELDESMPLSGPDEEWEKLHRNYMLDEAEKYAAVLPELDWVLCGQWPMEIRRSPGVEGQAKAVSLTNGRDNCVFYLRKIFEMECPDINSRAKVTHERPSREMMDRLR